MIKSMQVKIDKELLEKFDSLLTTRTRSQAIRDFIIQTVNKNKKV